MGKGAIEALERRVITPRSFNIKWRTALPDSWIELVQPSHEDRLSVMRQIWLLLLILEPVFLGVRLPRLDIGFPGLLRGILVRYDGYRKVACDSSE